MNGLTLLVTLALAIAIVLAFRLGALRGKRSVQIDQPPPLPPSAAFSSSVDGAQPLPSIPATAAMPAGTSIDAERARLIRGLEAETAALRRAAARDAAERLQLHAFAEERRRLFAELAEARSDAARYRDIVIDLENNAMPPLLDGANMIDDLKLIVGVGPVLERMLHQLGITTYRQVARWSERDIDEFDTKLPEFPGRIRRDAWVTQARALHRSKFGETPSIR